MQSSKNAFLFFLSKVIRQITSKFKLKGPNLKAKANASQAVDKLIQIATNKSSSEDYNLKHKSKAKYGSGYS